MTTIIRRQIKAAIEEENEEDPLEKALLGSSPSKSYRTHDLAFAAYLAASGILIRRAERDEETHRRIVFVFADDQKIKELRVRWMNGDDLISARSYSDCLRRLKAMIYEVDRGG